MSKEELINIFLAPGGAIDVLATFAAVAFGLIAAYYIFTSAANARALRMAGYNKAWLAWVPYLRYFAIADATKEEGPSTKIYGRWNVYNALYTLWFALLLVVQILDEGITDFIPATLGTILDIIIMGVFLGGAYAKLLSKISGKPERECYTFGIWSGVFPIVAAVRFCFVKKIETKEEDYGLEIMDLDKDTTDDKNPDLDDLDSEEDTE